MLLTTNVTLENHAECWHAIDWRKANRVVRNLRRRIFRATRDRLASGTVVEVLLS